MTDFSAETEALLGGITDHYANISQPAVSGVTFEVPGFEMGMIEVAASTMGVPVDQVFVAGAREVVDQFHITGKIPDTGFYESQGYFPSI